MAGHTYDKWQELGYQVKKGETAAYEYYGNKIFTKEQVFKVRSGRLKRVYVNHCWNCESAVDSRDDDQCDECNWLICSCCGSCGCF